MHSQNNKEYSCSLLLVGDPSLHNGTAAGSHLSFMKELEEAERYSIAALFTLALHSTAGAAEQNGDYCSITGLWGEPDEDSRRTTSTAPTTKASDCIDPFWGRDLVARGGLLDAIYFQLGLAPFKWSGLKALPSVAPRQDSVAFRGAVRSLIAVLDEDLAATLPEPPPRPLRRLRRSESPHADHVNVPDDLWDGLLSDAEDGDSHARDGTDASAGEKEELDAASPVNDDNKSSFKGEAEEILHELSRAERAHDAEHRHQLSIEFAELVTELERLDCEIWNKAKESYREADNAETTGRQGGVSMRPGTPEVSPIAVAALWELLQCCIGAALAGSEAAKVAADAEAEIEATREGRVGPLSGPTSPEFLVRQEAPPVVRWYDARARVAMHTVCGWLQVPQRKFSTLEVLLGSDALPATLSRTNRAGKSDRSISADRYRSLKVGLAALGGGALFAVTGGLAAPAIAAGVGSLLGIVPGVGASAGVVAGFMSTQVGVAAVTTTMATAGAATTGSKMAYRTADVKDFGFVAIPEFTVPAALTRASPVSSSSGALLGDAGKDGETTALDEMEEMDPGHLTKWGHNNGPSLQSSKPQSFLPPSSVETSLSTKENARLSGPSSATTAGSARWKGWFRRKDTLEAGVLLPIPLRVPPSVTHKQYGHQREESTHLSTVICVSGWISTAPDDFVTPWHCVRSFLGSERFGLVWCSAELIALSSALGALVAKGAAGQAARLGIQHLLGSGAGLVSALGPTVILGAAAGMLIENAWTVAMDRADKAGKILAQLLMSGGSGGRPVTFIAHSLGSRLVFSALLELEKVGARGLVENVVLLGAPVSPTPETRWNAARRVVAGRLVNGYSSKDWLLSVMFWQGIARPAAGIAPVSVEGIENVSLGSIISGHQEYAQRCAEILELLHMPLSGWST